MLKRDGRFTLTVKLILQVQLGDNTLKSDRVL
jgi:hypothetical protein